MTNITQQLKLLETKIGEAIREIRQLKTENANLREEISEMKENRSILENKNLKARKRIENIIESLQSMPSHQSNEH